jgi:branched-subunit amino acid aminotransferase/4-amino-4-deoxychorismate lyase
VADAGVVLGAAVTQQARTYRHKPFQLDPRTVRLCAMLDQIGLDAGLSADEWRAIAEQAVAENASLVPEWQELGVILLATPGLYPTYAAASARAPARASVCVHTFPLPYENWADAVLRGLPLVIPSVRQIPAESVDPALKCRSRMHYFLAEREAKRHDPRAAALLLDRQGRLTETIAANLFLVVDGGLVTPAADHVLPGHSRALTIERARQAGIAVHEAGCGLELLARTTEAFVTSTPHGLLPVASVTTESRQVFRWPVPGPLTHRMERLWADAVGLDPWQQILDGARLRRRP